MISNHNSNRINNLDSLRGLAAITVLLYHYTQRFTEIFPQYPKALIMLPQGRFGVHLFFIISGFVITMTLLRSPQLIDFLRNRWLRLYPAYWIALLITFVSVHFFYLPDRVRTVQELLVNMTMLQHFFHVRHVDGVYWTLSLELAFYLWMVFLAKLKLLQKPTLKYVLIVWLIGINAYFYLYQPRFVYDSTVFETIFLLRYGHLFFSGIAFYAWYQQKCLDSAITAILLLTLVAQWQIFAIEGLWILIVINLLFYSCVIKPILNLDNKLLVWLGGISYSLYLCHQYIGYIWLRAGYQKYALAPWQNISLAVLLVITIACLIHYLVERPCLKYFRK